MSRFNIPAVLVALLLASPAAAQNGDSVPAGHRPPAGMCRIWIDGVPAGQQSAPTDCATAIRNRPANGRVIFGDDYSSNNKKKKQLIPSGLFGGKKEVSPVKKLRDGDSQEAETPKVEAPKTKAAESDKKKDSKKAKKAKKPTDKSEI